MSEARWLQRYAAQGDAEAFALLLSRYEGMVFATCRRKLHDAGEAEDAAQEVFLRLAQRAGELRSNLGGWLHRCAVNVATDFNRRRQARARREAAAAKRETSDEGRESQEVLTELRENLDEAMERLDVESRELIIQRYFVGRSQAELAAEAKVAPSTIANRLTSAVEKLRAYLKLGGTSAGIAVAMLVAALEAEKACASVPAGLSANVMKIGLSGVRTAGNAAVQVRPWLARVGLRVALAAGLLAALAMFVWWLSVRVAGEAPAKVAPVVESPTEWRSDTESLAPVPSNEPPVTAEVRVWTAEGMAVTDARVKLLNLAGKEVAPADEKANKFSVAPGQYVAIVKPVIGETVTRSVEVGKGKNGSVAVDVLLR